MIPKKRLDKSKIAINEYQKDLEKFPNKLKEYSKNQKIAKYFLKTYLSNPNSLPIIKNLFLEEKSNENSLKRFGEKESFRRTLTASRLREYQKLDKKRSWGISFSASLRDLNNYFKLNLAKTIFKEYKGKKLNVCSIGCGTGLAESQLKRVLKDKINLHATGIKLLEKDWMAHKNFKEINWHVTHAERMSRELKQMDVVYSNLGFHHAASSFQNNGLNKAFKELSKILRKQGLAIINLEGKINLEELPKELKVISSKSFESKNKQGIDYEHQVLILRKI
jgi:SAM-dependent methyltransferase